MPDNLPTCLLKFLETLAEDEQEEILEFFDGNDDAASLCVESLERIQNR